MLCPGDESTFKRLWNGNLSFSMIFEVVAAADIDSDGISLKKRNRRVRRVRAFSAVISPFVIGEKNFHFWSCDKEKLLWPPRCSH